MRQSQQDGVDMNEGLELLLQLVNPVHCVKLSETWMILGVLDIRKCVKREKFRSSAQFSSFSVEILFEIVLFFFQVLLRFGFVLVLVVHVVNENDKVDPQVELELFDRKVFGQLLCCRCSELLPDFEKLIFLALVEGCGKLVQ